MREADIVYENLPYFLLREKSKNAQIAPVGSVYFRLYRHEGTHSVTASPIYVSANLERAKKACDYWASIAGSTFLPNGKALVKSVST
jgi:hypothetical protein